MEQTSFVVHSLDNYDEKMFSIYLGDLVKTVEFIIPSMFSCDRYSGVFTVSKEYSNADLSTLVLYIIAVARTIKRKYASKLIIANSRNYYIDKDSELLFYVTENDISLYESSDCIKYPIYTNDLQIKPLPILTLNIYGDIENIKNIFDLFELVPPLIILNKDKNRLINNPSYECTDFGIYSSYLLLILPYLEQKNIKVDKEGMWSEDGLENYVFSFDSTNREIELHCLVSIYFSLENKPSAI